MGNVNQDHNEIPLDTHYDGNNNDDDVDDYENNKCWQICWEIRTLIHCRDECKVLQLVWKALWEFLKKLNMAIHS